MYRSLYRKYRPKRFDEVAGQEHITKVLTSQLSSGRLAHAYVFSGTRGTGKTSCAKILAKAVNCETPIAGEPCNKCDACIGIDNESILDVTEMDAASNTRVEDMLALLEEANYLPAAVKKRVYIIDEIHMLSKHAFNALLKTLEEPPDHVLFVLATTELNKVPVTITSRCQRFVFKRLPKEIIAKQLLKYAPAENIPLTEDGASVIARLADGAMRDAWTLLERCQGADIIDRGTALETLGYIESEKIANLYRLAAEGNTAAAIGELNSIYMSGKDIGSVLEQLGSYLRDSLLVSISSDGYENLLSGAFEIDDLYRGDSSVLIEHADKLQLTLSSLDKMPDRKAGAEILLIKFTLPARQTALPNVPARGAVRPISNVKPAVSAVNVPDMQNVPNMPSDSNSPASSTAPFTWQALVGELKLSPLLLRSLKDPDTTNAEVSADTLNIRINDPFIEGLLIGAEIEIIREAAVKQSGNGSMRVIVNGAEKTAAVRKEAVNVDKGANPTSKVDALLDQFKESSIFQIIEDE